MSDTDPLRICLYLWGGSVPSSGEVAEALINDLADWLAERGFASTGDDDLPCVLLAGNEEVEGDWVEWMRELTKDEAVQMVVIPQAKGPHGIVVEGSE